MFHSNFLLFTFRKNLSFSSQTIKFNLPDNVWSLEMPLVTEICILNPKVNALNVKVERSCGNAWDF